MKVKCIPKKEETKRIKVDVILSRLPNPKVIKVKAKPVFDEPDIDDEPQILGNFECFVPDDVDSELSVSCQDCSSVSEEEIAEEAEDIAAVFETEENEPEEEPEIVWEGFEECAEQTVEDEPEEEEELDAQKLTDALLSDIEEGLEAEPISAAEAFDLLCMEDDEEGDMIDINASFAELANDVDDSLSRCVIPETEEEPEIEDEGMMYRHFERDKDGERYETDELQAEGHEVACFDEDGKLRRLCGVIKKNSSQAEKKKQIDDIFSAAVSDMFGSDAEEK